MPSITVRHISEDIHRGLRVRAAKNGRSMEAELRVVLAIAAGTRRPERPASSERPDGPAQSRVPQELLTKLHEILRPAAE